LRRGGKISNLYKYNAALSSHIDEVNAYDISDQKVIGKIKNGDVFMRFFQSDPLILYHFRLMRFITESNYYFEDYYDKI